MAANQYLVTMTITDPQKRVQLREQQQEFIKRLRQSGTVERVWRYTETPGGVVILNATSKAEAERIYGESPFARGGVVQFEVSELEPAE